MSLLKSKNKLVSISNHQKENQPSFRPYFSTMLLASLIGTYSDLWMVGKGDYSFPVRPFPNIFSINILFTLCILPLATCLIIYVFKRVRWLTRLVLTAGSSLAIALIEQMSEIWGWLTHSDQWSHFYSIIGYFVFISLIWKTYNWLSKS